MAYTSDIFEKRITIQQRTKVNGKFGASSAGYTTTDLGEVWASVTWSKGVRAMREGAMDAYDKVMIRTRWHDFLTRDCQIVCDGVTYVIDTFHADKHANTIQITATELKG